MPLKMLGLPVPKASAKLRRAIQKRFQAPWNAGDLDTITLLRRELRVGILEGCVAAPELAARFGVSARTLNRHLSTANLRFHQVLDETRSLFVQQLLANTPLTISEIAKIVGYTEQAALTRSFTRWIGITPSEWRVK